MSNGPAPGTIPQGKSANAVKFVFEPGVLPIQPALCEMRDGEPYMEYNFVTIRNTFGHTAQVMPLRAVNEGDVAGPWVVLLNDEERVVHPPEEAW